MSTPARRAPPAPAKPGKVKVFKALYAYEAQQKDELSFEEGDTLYVYNQENDSWWRARCNNKDGLIPYNYVKESTESLDFPLHEAAKRGNLPFLKECLSNKVSVNGLDKAGSTPLHWAAHGGHIDCLRELLNVTDQRCEVNVQNKLGDTPIHSAAWKNHSEVIQILIERGAKANIRNNDKRLPIDLAKDPACAALLKQTVAPRTYSQDYGDEEDSD